MRWTILILVAALVSTGLGLAVPQAAASPCHSVNHCLERLSILVGCHREGGDIVGRPLDWNWDLFLDCLMMNLG